MRSPQITWISKHDPPDVFPAASSAYDVPDGLLAAGGDLSVARLKYAYQNGIFPWYDDGQPILWWSPDPRCVLPPSDFHLSRRLGRYLRRSNFEVSFNTHFDRVINGCAENRAEQAGTWITADMNAAYQRMHREGWAHSVEIWSGEELVGGMYGLAIGRAFFGESMFSTRSNASKASMFALCGILLDSDFQILDCQVESPHLLSLGAKLIPRPEFLAVLADACEPAVQFSDWPQDRRKINTFGDI